MANSNKAVMLEMTKKYPMLNVQLAWDNSHVRVNYLLYNANVYATGNMSADEIRNLFADLQREGKCDVAKVPSKLNPALKGFLIANGIELANNMRKGKETAKKIVDTDTIYKNEKDLFDEESLYDKDGCLVASPRKIVTKRLSSLQEEDKDRYVEPIGKLCFWYYNNFDITHEDIIKDLETVNFKNVCDKFVRINNSYTSIAVMREVLQAYADFYKINHKIDMADIVKMSKVLEQVGVGA